MPTDRDQTARGAHHHGHGDHGHAHHGHGHGDHADAGGHRTHRFSADHAERLLSEDRAQSFPPEAALRNAGVGPGMTVVDLGCGPGFFTIPARHVVGTAGHVIAADVQPEMLDHLRGRLTQAGITDVHVVLTNEGRVPVADAVADVVWAAFVLHEANDPGAFLAECARLVKPGGAVAIVEWRHEVDLEIRADHRIAIPVVTAHATAAGLARHDVQVLDDARVLVRVTRANA